MFSYTWKTLSVKRLSGMCPLFNCQGTTHLLKTLGREALNPAACDVARRSRPRWAAGLDAAAEGAIRRCVLPWARTRPAGAAGLPCQGPHCGNGAGQSTRTIVWRLQGQQPVQGCWPSWRSPIGAQWTSDWRRCGEPQAAQEVGSPAPKGCAEAAAQVAAAPLRGRSGEARR